MCAHTWENPEIYQIRTQNQANQNDWPIQNVTYKWFKLLRGCDSLSESAHVSTRTYHFLITSLLVSLLSVFVGIFFAKSKGKALSLNTGLVTRIQHSHYCGPTSVSGQEPKPHFRLLQAEAIWDQFYNSR